MKQGKKLKKTWGSDWHKLVKDQTGVIGPDVIRARDLKDLEKELMTMSVKMLKLETVHKSWNFLLKGSTLITGIFNHRV